MFPMRCYHPYHAIITTLSYPGQYHHNNVNLSLSPRPSPHHPMSITIPPHIITTIITALSYYHHHHYHHHHHHHETLSSSPVLFPITGVMGQLYSLYRVPAPHACHYLLACRLFLLLIPFVYPLLSLLPLILPFPPRTFGWDAHRPRAAVFHTRLPSSS